MPKISINMLSSADKVAGQGVGSAYLEQVNLLKEGASDLFDIRINSKKKADIIHAHTIDFNNYVSMKMRKAITVAYVHFLPHTLDGSIKLPIGISQIFKKYVIEFYKNTDYLIVVNPMFIKELESYDIPREKIMYIPNYVSKEKFYKQSKKEVEATRKKLGIKKDDFVVMGSGQVQTRKGLFDFIECANRMPDVTFVWCGGFSFGRITDGYDELKKIYDNPPSNVKFLGIVPREEMNSMFNMADVFFLPSYDELFPMVILESNNIGKPCLLRDIELYKEILFDKYAKGNNVDEFVEELKKLRDDKEYCQKYSKYALELAEFYSKEHVLNIWREFYTRIYKEQKDKIKESV